MAVRRGQFTSDLPDGLWGESGPQCRSVGLSPIYVERHVGPRQKRLFTEHTFWELTFVFKGKGTFHSPDPLPIGPNTAVLVPPDIPHREESPGSIDTLWVGVRGSRLESLSGEHPYVLRHKDLAQSCDALWRRAERPYGPIGPELDGLALALFGMLLRLLREEESMNADRIDNAVGIMNRRFSEDISMGDLALECGCSEGHFYRTFKARTGQTPVQYLRQIRIRHARRWLEHTTLPVERIAHMCGFRDPLYFSRVFTRNIGVCPSAVRQR